MVHLRVAVGNPPVAPPLPPLVEADVVEAVLPLPPSDGCAWPPAELRLALPRLALALVAPPTPLPPQDVAVDELTPSGGVAAFKSADPALP